MIRFVNLCVCRISLKKLGGIDVLGVIPEIGGSVSLFGRPFVKRFTLCYQTVVSVCNVRALWPNGWTDQDDTWRAGRPRPCPHCVRWGPTSPSPQRAQPPFSAHICCGQMAAWIKMSLAMELDLGPGDFVLDGDPVPFPSNFRPMFIVAKRLDGSRWYLTWR